MKKRIKAFLFVAIMTMILQANEGQYFEMNKNKNYAGEHAGGLIGNTAIFVYRGIKDVDKLNQNMKVHPLTTTMRIIRKTCEQKVATSFLKAGNTIFFIYIGEKGATFIKATNCNFVKK